MIPHVSDMIYFVDILNFNCIICQILLIDNFDSNPDVFM